MASFPLPDSKLSALQRDVLLAFFEREQRFFLTGGSALGGFYLLHRYSDDLDLFTTDQEASGDAERALDAARPLAARPCDRFVASPNFAATSLREAKRRQSSISCSNAFLRLLARSVGSEQSGWTRSRR